MQQCWQNHMHANKHIKIVRFAHLGRPASLCAPYVKRYGAEIKNLAVELLQLRKVSEKSVWLFCNRILLARELKLAGSVI